MSGKLIFLRNLLKELKKNGHRVLIFSQSIKMLDIIQRVVSEDGYEFLRIDGQVTDPTCRQHRIDMFNANNDKFAFLLTTGCGGVGITLTGADRVVMYDPSWNPAVDAQAVDRAYRIGQNKDVVVYRLVTCGTLEEKIYRKQIFKGSIMKSVSESENPYRYFKRDELRNLFKLENVTYSKTQVQLSALHSHRRQTDEYLDKHIDFLETLNIYGISDHDLLFTTRNENESKTTSAEAIDAVQKALKRMAISSANERVPEHSQTSVKNGAVEVESGSDILGEYDDALAAGKKLWDKKRYPESLAKYTLSLNALLDFNDQLEMSELQKGIDFIKLMSRLSSVIQKETAVGV